MAAYHVSGEYSMLKAAPENGWIDERQAVIETLTADQAGWCRPGLHLLRQGSGGLALSGADAPLREPRPKVRSRKAGAAVPLDATDKLLLNLLQSSFPLEPRAVRRPSPARPSCRWMR